MKSYIIINSANNNTNNSNNISILNIFSNLYNCNEYINNISKLLVDDSIQTIIKVMDNIPTNNDIDGYYLIKNSSNSYDIYLKKIITAEGYIYNSYDLSINKVGQIDICIFDDLIVNKPKNINYIKDKNDTYASVINELKTILKTKLD